MKQKVLFICVHNSARSQMAAALLNEVCGEFFEAQSAGLEPGTLNPLAVEALQEIGIDISSSETQSVFDVFKSGQLFAYVITVCSESESKGFRYLSLAIATGFLHFARNDGTRSLPFSALLFADQ